MASGQWKLTDMFMRIHLDRQPPRSELFRKKICDKACLSQQPSFKVEAGGGAGENKQNHGRKNNDATTLKNGRPTNILQLFLHNSDRGGCLSKCILMNMSVGFHCPEATSIHRGFRSITIQGEKVFGGICAERSESGGAWTVHGALEPK